MTDSFETAGVTLVTIVVPITLADGIVSDLRELGVTGYTTVKANGWGQHGTREFGLNDEPNLRIETLVSAKIARTILALIDAKSSDNGMIAFALYAEAVPRRHFP
jgi:hypothetical protein